MNGIMEPNEPVDLDELARLHVEYQSYLDDLEEYEEDEDIEDSYEEEDE